MHETIGPKYFSFFSSLLLKPISQNSKIWSPVHHELHFQFSSSVNFTFKSSEAAITTLHFLRNLWMGAINLTACHWQAFTAYCDVTLWLIGPIWKLRVKWSVVNIASDDLKVKLTEDENWKWKWNENFTFKSPEAVFTTVHFTRNFQIGPISQSVTSQ